MADKVCCRQGVVARLSMSTAVSGGTDMLYKLTASTRKLSEGEARPAVLMDAINAAVDSAPGHLCLNSTGPASKSCQYNSVNSLALCEGVSDLLIEGMQLI